MVVMVREGDTGGGGGQEGGGRGVGGGSKKNEKFWNSLEPSRTL